MSLKFSKIRLLETRQGSGPWNMGLDQALMSTVEDFIPVLRLYGWKPSAVSIGYFQSLEQEVDVKKCKELGIDVVRRITGGGAVLHEHELTYSFITKVYPANIIESYRSICEPVVMCLYDLGFDAKFSPLNDIAVENKKVSGNAQTRRNNVLLQHGTILLDVNVDKMFSVLKVPSEKIKDKIIQDVKERVMGLKMSYDEVANKLWRSFGQKFQAEIFKDDVKSDESIEAKIMQKYKYSTYEWNYKR
ncbi:MAG TPA: biotin/lipoate A/B protein ligase family protein [Nitrososphaeraceae archaeon]|nr:biotin/lipoate A/B protein ligase family protein [Nitrososphaeraceae archaeon]